MNAALSRFLRSLNVYYDKIIALAVLLFLLVSLLILLVRIGTDQAEHERFTREIERLTPVYPEPEPLDLVLFENARRRLHEPFQIPEWAALVTSPERRVHCVNCVRPIPYAADICAYCQFVQPDETAPPTDEWVAQHGVDPRDPTMSDVDLDGDGFTVLEEYIFGTDPNDPESFPAPWVRLRLDVIVSEPFQMLFMGRSRLGQRDLYQINMRTDGRTQWVEIGEEVEGFRLTGYEERFEGTGYARRDVSVLTLERGDIRIELVRGEVTPHLQHHARLFFEIDDSEHRVVRGSEIELMNETYRVLQIDPDEQRVLLQSEEEETLWIGATSLSSREIDAFR